MAQSAGWELDFYDFRQAFPGDASIGADIHARARANGARHGTPLLTSPSGRADARLNRFFRHGAVAALRPQTWRRYAYSILVWLDFLEVRPRAWDEAAAGDVEAFRDWRLTDQRNPERVTPAAFSVDRAALNALYGWAWHEYGIANPVPAVQRVPGLEAGPGSGPEGPELRRRDGLRPAGAARRQVKWMLRPAYQQWRDIGLRGYGFGGRRRPGWHGFNEDRDAAFADGLYGTGLRLGEWASILDVELPAEGGVGRYPMAWLSAACIKGGREGRQARDRIAGGRALLHRYRQCPGQLEPGQRLAGEFLDELDRYGVLPRRSGRNLSHAVAAAGGAQWLCRQLCLTYTEAAAFGLMLTAVTGQNFGTVVTWPALHYRPDGGDDTVGIALLEAVKPRRGPGREHMITSLEDVPGSLSAVLDAGDAGDRHLFRSPLRLYRLLLDLSALARAHGGHASAFGYVSPRTRTMPDWWRGGLGPGAVHKWARARGFATRHDDPELRISAWAPRQTVVERKRTPIAHTAQMMNDRYLGRSEAVQAESRELIAAALDGQVHAARDRLRIRVLPASLIARAAHDPQAAAAEAGLSPQVMADLAGGRLDTVAAGCIDNAAGPGTPPVQPCRASFLTCLDCPNSRALPHHLPVQIAVHDRLGILRDNIPPAQWDARHDRAHSQLGDIIGHYTAADKDAARAQLTARQEQLADDLVHGRLDLR